MTPIILLLVPLFLPAAPAGHQGQLAAEFSLQGQRIAAACPPRPSSLATCPIEFLTDHPIHLAAGSLAPQNGFAFGPAFVTHRYSDARDISWSADGVVAPGGSWRAGLYFKMVLTPVADTTTVPITLSAASTDADVVIHPYPIIDAYVQATSLRTVFFYGLGPDSTRADQAAFGMQETVVGTRAVYPLFARHAIRSLNLSAIGEVNGRFVDLRDPKPSDLPPVSAVYDEQTAPGLSTQPGVVQFGEGVRMKPVVLNNRLQFNYAFVAAQFVAASDSHYSFQRWTADLDQEFSFYRTVIAPASRDTHGPNDCSMTLASSPCPTPSLSRNRYGSVGFQVYASRSWAGGSGAVPFYFQQTLGGSDIDGERRLSAYEDYRFRGPGVVLLREHLEHYIYGVVGATVEAEQGTVAAPGAALSFAHLKHNTAAGLSLRAGGLPVASVTWAWGSEGHRLIAVVNASLLGGGKRPSLY